MTLLEQLLANQSSQQKVSPIFSKEDVRSLYKEVSKKLESDDLTQNAQAIQGILGFTKTTGKELTSPSMDKGDPEKKISLEVSKGELIPSDPCRALFKSLTGAGLPTLGEIEPQDIDNHDAWTGFQASKIQSGKRPKGQDAMSIELLNGEAPDELTDPSQSPDDVWGPSRVYKGALEKNDKEISQGIAEIESIGIEPSKEILGVLDPKTPGLDSWKETAQQLTSVTKGLESAGGNAIPIPIPGLTTSLPLIGGQKEKGGAEAGGKEGKESATGPEGNDKDGGPSLPSGLSADAIAGMVAGKITYNFARTQGVTPQAAGGMAVAAKKEAELTSHLAHSPSQSSPEQSQQAPHGPGGGHGQGQNHEIEAAKKSKNMALGAAASAAKFIPGYGTAISIGLQIADKATDVVMDLVKDDKVSMVSEHGVENKEQGQGGPTNPGTDAGPPPIPAQFVGDQLQRGRSAMVKKNKVAQPQQFDTAGAIIDGAMSIGNMTANTAMNDTKNKKVEDHHAALDGPAM
jgi:hypothetical protein